MSPDMTADEIKRIRKSYGLSQKAFARVLGIGEASMVRYENGVKPSKANANLIRAARNKTFMLDCLERDGELIPQAQREEAERIIYAELVLGEKGEVMDINEIYEITLQQEILNEQAAEMLADLHRMERAALERGDEASAMVYQDAAKQIAIAKGNIISQDYDSFEGISKLRGEIDGLMRFAQKREAKVAA